jgi:hypothetical protein
MATNKITVSIQKSLFEQVAAIAQTLDISNNVILELAINDFIQRYQMNKNLLQQLNKAYDDLPNAEDNNLLKTMKSRQKNLVEGQW